METIYRLAIKRNSKKQFLF